MFTKTTYLAFRHKNIVCRKKCNEVLSCGHSCTKRCHVPTPNQHDPCRILVDKTIPECGHKVRFQCARTPTITDCQQKILKRLPCDHAVNVPCPIVSSPSELKRFPCSNLCNTMLACKHKCAGTCGRCRTGQLHIPCQEKCERELICSHVSVFYNKNKIKRRYFFTSRFVKHLVLRIVHPVCVNVKHVVFILNAKRNVVNYVHRAKRFV
jgi:hypothetical protein